MNSIQKLKTIKVGSRTYVISLVDDNEFKSILGKQGIDDIDIKSFIDYDSQSIFVRNRLVNDHKRELILHELIHACIEDAGVNDENIEKFVSILSPRLIQLVDELPVILKEVV